MSAFKIDDKVRRLCAGNGRDHHVFYGSINKISAVGEDGALSLYGDKDQTPGWSPSFFELVEDKDSFEPAPQEAGPVRAETVTRTIIVPGRYGCVTVKSETNGSRVQLEIETTCDGLKTWYDADELRAAARVFNSLAEALESQP